KAAKTAYNTVLQREPQNEDAILGLTEVYLAQDNKDAARTALAKLPAAQNGEPLSINMQRRLAMAQAGLGDHAAAEKTFNAILPQAKSQP
ncbi:tetratricopeptide repeat protein, partial [Enterobacter hormaechei]